MRWAGLRTLRLWNRNEEVNLTILSSSNFVALQAKEEDEDAVDGVDENTTVMFLIWDKNPCVVSGCRQKQTDTVKY